MLDEIVVGPINRFLGNKELVYPVTNLKFKKFQKPENIEKILAEKSLTSSSAWVRFFDQSMTRLKFKINGKAFSETEVLNLLSSHSKIERKNAAEVFG